MRQYHKLFKKSAGSSKLSSFGPSRKKHQTFKKSAGSSKLSSFGPSRKKHQTFKKLSGPASGSASYETEFSPVAQAYRRAMRYAKWNKEPESEKQIQVEADTPDHKTTSSKKSSCKKSSSGKKTKPRHRRRFRQSVYLDDDGKIINYNYLDYRC